MSSENRFKNVYRSNVLQFVPTYVVSTWTSARNGDMKDNARCLTAKTLDRKRQDKPISRMISDKNNRQASDPADRKVSKHNGVKGGKTMKQDSPPHWQAYPQPEHQFQISNG